MSFRKVPVIHWFSKQSWFDQTLFRSRYLEKALGHKVWPSTWCQAQVSTYSIKALCRAIRSHLRISRSLKPGSKEHDWLNELAASREVSPVWRKWATWFTEKQSVLKTSCCGGNRTICFAKAGTVKIVLDLLVALPKWKLFIEVATSPNIRSLASMRGILYAPVRMTDENAVTNTVIQWWFDKRK